MSRRVLTVLMQLLPFDPQAATQRISHVYITCSIYNVVVGSYRFCTGSAPDKVVEWYFVIFFGNSC